MCYNDGIGSIREMVMAGYELNKDHIHTFRRHIHSYPEVGWKETATTAYILKARRCQSATL